MRKIIGIVAAVGAVMAVAMLAEPIGQTWTGDGAFAQAKSKSSACFQNCRNVRNWPASQCRQFCKGRR